MHLIHLKPSFLKVSLDLNFMKHYFIFKCEIEHLHDLIPELRYVRNPRWANLIRTRPVVFHFNDTMNLLGFNNHRCAHVTHTKSVTLTIFVIYVCIDNISCDQHSTSSAETSRTRCWTRPPRTWTGTRSRPSAAGTPPTPIRLVTVLA